MLTKLGLKFYDKTDNKEDCSNCTYIISQYILSILRNLVSKLTKEDLRYNAVAFFRLTSQKQKETAGMPEYARKGKAALSKESFFLQEGPKMSLESFLKNRLCYMHPYPTLK